MGERQLAAVRSPREPRRDHRLEAVVLAEAMLDDSALATAVSLLEPVDFDDAAHSAIFEAMQSLSADNHFVDSASIAARLEQAGRLDAVGGEARLGAIALAAHTAQNVEQHIRLLVELSTTRKLYRAARDIATAACDASVPADDAIDRAMTLLFDVAKGRTGDPVSIDAALDEATATLTDRDDMERAKKVRGESTGFESLDALIAGRGFKPARTYVFGAPPGNGKSTLVVNMVRRIAGRKVPCLMFSMEGTRKEVGDRMLCLEARVDGSKYEAGTLTAEECQALTEARQRLRGITFFIDDTREITITQIRAKAKRHKKRHGLGLLVVDYLQLIQVPGTEGDEYARITSASVGLTALADELKVPVIVISSFNRSYAKDKKGTVRRPMISDLNGSGRIESDAALVALLFREELYDENSDQKGLCDFIIAKQRHGPWPRTITLKFDAQCQRFDDYIGNPPEPEPQTNLYDPYGRDDE